MKGVLTSMCVGLTLLAFTSCTKTSQDVAVTRTPADARATPPAGDSHDTRVPAVGDRHWVQSEQLSALMNRISAQMLSDYPEGLHRPRSDQDPAQVERSMASAAKLATELAASAEQIPAQVEQVKMGEADRAGFKAEADILRKQALELGQAAESRQVEKMQKSLAAISSTCISCHSRYRDFAGELDTQRATAPPAEGPDRLVHR